jgi:hypothetical protein
VQEHGYNVPPITDTTRSVLIKKLNQLDQQRRQDQRQATPRKQGQNKDCKWRILKIPTFVFGSTSLPHPNPAACMAGCSIVPATWYKQRRKTKRCQKYAVIAWEVMRLV